MLSLTDRGIWIFLYYSIFLEGAKMNWLTESIVVLWFLPVVLFILLPLSLMACHLVLGIFTGMHWRSGESVPITKEVGAGA
jgi:hypothetical protein